MRKNRLLIPGLFSLLVLGSCGAGPDPKLESVKHAIDVACSQLELSSAEFDSLPGFPRSLMPKFKVVDAKDWTSGFYPGTLWEAYRLTGDEIRGTDDGSGSETTDSTIPGNSVIDARVFEALNLDLPELASVKAYYESDQYYLAAQALLNYFRARTQVNANVNLIAPSITAEEQARADWALPVTGDAQDGYRFWVDGLKLCQTVKQNIRTCHIPVVMLAPDGGLEKQITGIEAGADGYLPMPLSITLLAAKVQNLLKARYRMRHHYSDDAEIDPDKITSNSMDGEFLKKAIRIVEENLDNEEFSSNDFSKALCMSRSNLHLKMKSITGESATKFIRKIRFNRACQLLLEPKYSIAEISSMVGFNSPSYFATSFKKHVGCLPTEYVRARTCGDRDKESRDGRDGRDGRETGCSGQENRENREK